MKYLAILASIIFAVAMSLGCIGTSTVVVKSKQTFPTVSGTDLHGETRTLPDYLSKPRTIVVVAFQRWQQSLCDEWYEYIEQYNQQNEHAAYFEIPTIAKMNSFSRWFIYNGMRGGIKDDFMRSQVITLHIDKESFKNALQIDSEETVYVYVMNEEGEILEQIKGKWSAEKWQQAIKALEVEEI